MTAVLIIPLAFSNAGEGTWLAYLFGTVMLLFVVFCLNQFARRCAAPGAMYTYTARGLGAGAGVFSGWTLIWSYLFIGVAGLSGFAIFCAQFLSALGFKGTISRSSSSRSAPWPAGTSPTRTSGFRRSSPWSWKVCRSCAS
jgi:amino acid transporter